MGKKKSFSGLPAFGIWKDRDEWELTDEDIDQLVKEELAELNKLRVEQGLPSTTWLGELDPHKVAKAAQKKLVERLKQYHIRYGLKDGQPVIVILEVPREEWQAVLNSVEK